MDDISNKNKASIRLCVWLNFLAALFLAVIPAKAGIQNAQPGVIKEFFSTAGAVSGWSGEAGP
jgi:hypothetical protein